MSTTQFRPAATTALERASIPAECQCCGRSELKTTVKVVSLDGGTTLWMGTGCAAKACGVGVREFGKSLKAAQDAQYDVEWKARDAEAKRAYAHFQAFLDARCPQFAGDRLRQLEALGGMRAAREGYVPMA